MDTIRVFLDPSSFATCDVTVSPSATLRMHTCDVTPVVSFLSISVIDRAGASLSAYTFLVVHQFFVLIEQAFFEFVVGLWVSIGILC